MRVLLLAMLCGFTAPLFSNLATAQGPAGPPNVVFIISDDLTAALGAYGRPVITPNIDSIANRGMRFDNVYTQYPVCGPSRAAIMTGLYPQSIGTLANGSSNFRDRHPNVTTMPQLFRQNGYVSARVSKIYHMGVPGDILNGTSGIDDSLSWDTAINIQAPEANAAGFFEDLSPMVTGQGVDFITVESTEGALAHADGMAAQEAVDWLRERNTTQPFFLAVGMVRPHVPLVAPQEYFDMYPLESIELPLVPVGDLDDVPSPAQTQTNAIKYGMNEDQQRRAIRGYYATISYMDAQVGRVLDELDAQGLTDNTIVVFTSDHGYNLGEHTTWQKLSLFEDTLRVPLLMAGPGIPQGSSTGIIEQIDIYPTIAQLAGLMSPNYIHGQSFFELFTNPQAQEWQDEASYAITFNGGESVTTSHWRYNRWANGEIELYDQRLDPNEFTNLADNPDHAAIIATMQSLLVDMRERAASFDINEGLGDFNNDGEVDVADWLLFRPHILADLSGLTSDQAFALGDFDRSGRIDGADFAVFKNLYELQNGEGSFSHIGDAVPEPTSCAILVISALLLATYRHAGLCREASLRNPRC